MNDEFVMTRLTLLRRIAVEKTGEDEASWCRFFDLYYPAMVAFARKIGGGEHAEDIAQEVLAKLVDVLRHGRYERQDGKSFRAYLKTLLRNQMNDRYRQEVVRGLGRKVELTEEIAQNVAAFDERVGGRLDAEWADACRKAAVEHVLTKTALSEQTKAVYRAYAIDERSIGDVAKEFGISRNYVSKIKERVDKMVVALEAEYNE